MCIHHALDTTVERGVLIRTLVDEYRGRQCAAVCILREFVVDKSVAWAIWEDDLGADIHAGFVVDAVDGPLERRMILE